MSWHFADPQQLFWFALPLVPILLAILRRRSPRKKGIVAFSGPTEIMRRESRRKRWIFRSLFAGTAASLTLFVWVLARPVTTESWTEKTSEGIDIVITLDVSDSMVADDFLPSRIVVAKNVIADFIRKREHDRIGLNVFAGESVTKSPLTRDKDFLQKQVQSIELRELKQGTAIGMGLANALARLKGSTAKSKIIVLLTDGDSNVGAINPVTASQLARQEGVKIYTVGMGHKNRVIIPIYQYDESGRRGQLIARIPSYINPALLRDIAKTTGGKAYMARDSGMLGRILQEIDRLERTKIKMIPRERHHDEFFYPALIATLILLAIFVLQETRYRKGVKRYVAAI